MGGITTETYIKDLLTRNCDVKRWHGKFIKLFIYSVKTSTAPEQGFAYLLVYQNWTGRTQIK